MKKGALELEYVAKMMILVVAVGIIISIMYYLYEKSKSVEYVIPSQEDTLSGGIEVETQELTDQALIEYLKACYYKNYKNNHDMLCYLITTNTPMNKEHLSNLIEKENLNFDVRIDENTPSQISMLIISYRFEDNSIYLKGR